MQPTQHKVIYTIGHSMHPADVLIEMLLSFEIKMVADIRSYPGSKRFPHYNKEALRQRLTQTGIQYQHFADLGGRRPASPDEAVPKHAPFGSYKEHMKTEAFEGAISELQALALTMPVAYMCAEANWRHCHRSLVSDYLKKVEWKVIHITGAEKSEPHVLTAPKRVQGRLFGE